jgi:SAM-dependent methyltransferase
MKYLMESVEESRRLLAQEEANPSLPRLVATGLEPGHRAIDVGCGSGAVLGEILDVVGAAGDVVGIDPSADRLAVASRLLRHRPNLRLLEAALPDTGLPDNSFDYVWCQYVCQYLPDASLAVKELTRLARSGAKVVVAEIDAHGLHNWPFTDELAASATKMLRVLERVGFDAFAGRKMFSRFRAGGLSNVKVMLTPFYVVAGAASEWILDDWRVRFRNLAPLAVAEFGSEDAYEQFARDYLALLADPDALKYAVILTTEGTKA